MQCLTCGGQDQLMKNGTRNGTQRYECSPCKRIRRLIKYGITVEDFERQMEYQNNRCAICHIELTMPIEGNLTGDVAVVDHDHLTGEVRGILCNHCNRGIGLLGDDVAGVMRAAAYLLAPTWHNEWTQDVLPLDV